MKKLLLIPLLFFGFIGFTHANLISDLFFPKLEKYSECLVSLEKQNIICA